MKKQESAAYGILADIFENARKNPKTYEDLVADGAAMQRLMSHQDFKTYEKLLAEALVLLVRRMTTVHRDDLAAVQGALIQHQLISNLPTKVVETASRLVEQNREQESKNGRE